MKFVIVLFSIFALVCALAQAADKAVCQLPKEVGPCRKADLQFWYNSEEKQCQEFFYGGCRGNDNRFASKEECEKTCSE